MKDTADTVGEFLVDALHYLALFAIGGTTVWSAAAAFAGMAAQGRASLGDILREIVRISPRLQWLGKSPRPHLQMPLQSEPPRQPSDGNPAENVILRMP